MKTYLDIPYKGELKLDIYTPDTEGFTTFVWFHGGGLENGSRKGCDSLAENAAKFGYGFVSVEYRMYPDAHYPDFIHDSADSVAFVQKHISEYGGNGKVVITGQSAGAYLTMMLYCNPAFLRNAFANFDKIVAFIPDSAQVTTHFNVLRERGVDSRAERIDEAAPLFYTDKLYAPKPLLLIWYTDDMPCRPEQNKLIYKSLTYINPTAPIQGIELPGSHCAGSVFKNDEGDYPYIVESVRFLQNI